MTLPKNIDSILRERALPHAGHHIENQHCQRPYNITFVLAQPRSGSTLLMRLMNMACLTEMTGDKPIQFYEGVVKMYQALRDPERGQFGHMITAEDKKEFWDEYRGISREREQHSFRFVTGLCIGYGGMRSCYSKSTMLGFGNDLVGPFVEMLRDTYEGNPRCNVEYNLRIVFLRRPHDEIIHSLQTIEPKNSLEKKTQETALKDPSLVRDVLESQDQQFRQAYELGDGKITYEQLQTDTLACLKKLNPIYHPNLKAVESIMATKIR